MRTKTRLTKTSVERLRAPTASGRQEICWDAELPGFGVLLSGVTSARTYVAQRRVDGRSRRVTVGHVAELEVEEARTQAGRALNDMRQGKDPKAAARERRGGATLEEARDEYLASSVGTNLKDKTRAAYRRHTERHLADWLGRRLRTITPEEVVRRHTKIAADVVAAAPAAITTGAAAANVVMRVFSAIWNGAAKTDPALPPNPVRALRRGWFHVPRRERLVRADDLPRFYAAARTLPNQVQADLVLTMLFTGLRRGEAAGLREGDLDFAGGLVRLPAERAKNSRKLDLPMTSALREILLRRKAAARDGWLFPASAKSGHVQEPKFAFQQIAEACGVAVSSHDLRRTFISVASATPGLTPTQLKALVNHATGVGDVTEGYVVFLSYELRGPAQLVADRMKLLCGIAEEKRGKVKRFEKKAAR